MDYNEDQQVATDPIDTLYKVVSEKGLYSKSIDEFKKQYSAPDQIDKLYQVLKDQGLYSKSKEEFSGKYFSSANAIPKLDYRAPVQQSAPKETAAIPNPNLPKSVPAETTADQFTKKHIEAQNTLHQELTGNNELIPDIIKKQKTSAQADQNLTNFAQQPRSDQPQTATQQIASSLLPKPPEPTVDDQDVTEFMQRIQTDPNAGRGFLQHVSQVKPDKAKAIQSASYMNDAMSRLSQDPDSNAGDTEGKVVRNAQDIEKGKLNYSVQSGMLTKPEDAWESIATGLQQKRKAFADYDLFNKATPDEAISELEKRRAEHDPDEPIPVPKGFSAELAGGMASQPFLGLAAGKVAGGATALIPGAEGYAPAVDKFVSAAVSSNDFRKMSYAHSLQQNYNQLRNEGMDPKAAYEKANGQAKDEAAVDAIGGAAMMLGAGSIGEVKLPSFNLSEGFKSAVVNGLKQGAKGIGEAGAVGLIQGAGQDIKNKLAEDKGIQRSGSGDDIKDAVESGTLFTLGMAAIAKGSSLLSAKTRSQILQGLSKATPGQVDAELGSQVMEQHITPEEAIQAKKEIEDHRILDTGIPDNVTEESRMKIQDKIKRRNYLETQLESSDAAFHPEIKEKIKAVNEDILELAKDKVPRGETQGIQSPKIEENRGTAEEEPPKTSTAQEPIKPVSDKIQTTSDLRTWDLGDMEGKPEDAEAKKHIEGVVQSWDKHPAGETGGETFGQFVGRVIPAFKKILSGEESNTTVITHSSVLKAMKVWDEMGRPEVSDLTPEQKTEFATKYNKEETYNGDLETFKGDKGDIHVIRHGQTEDNAKNNFRSGNTNLTSEGEKQAAESGQQLGRQTGGEVPKIITSDLPRAIHTSNIIHGELTGNSVPQNVPRENIKVNDNIQSSHFDGERKVIHVAEDGSHVIVTYPEGDHIKHEIPVEDIKPPEKPPVSEPAKEEPADDNKTISTKNKVADVIRNENGLPPVEIPRDRSDDASLNAWRDGTRTPQGIVDQLLSDKDIYDKSITPNDEPIMREYIRGLVNRGIELNKLSESLNDKVKEGDEAAIADQASVKQQLLNHYDEMARALDAERIGGNIWHKYGVERQMAVNEQGQIVNSINRIKTIYGDDMPTEMKSKLSDLQQKYDSLVAKNSKIEDELKKEQVENDLLKQAAADKKSGKRSGKTGSDFKKERSDILADMKAALKDANKKMYSAIPLTPQLAAIAPHVLKLFRSFGEEGVDELSDMIDKIHDVVKDVVDGISKNDVLDILAGKHSEKSTLSDLQKKLNDLRSQAKLKSNIADLEKGISIATKKKGEQSEEVLKLKDQLTAAKKKSLDEYAHLSAEESKKQIATLQKQIDKGDFFKLPTEKKKWENNPEWRKNEQQKANLKQDLRNMVQEAYDSKKSMYMRSLDWVNRWGRRVIFFGANAVYTKLSSAAVLGAFVHRPFESIAGKINAKLYPHIAANAPIEGNINMAAEAKFYKEFLNIKKFAENIWSQARHGETPLSKELGRHSNEKHIPIVDLFAADAHVMIKDPVKRASFEAAVMNHLKFYADHNIDGTHPLMLESARQAAYKTAEYEIFQNSSKNAGGVKKFFNELEKKGIENANMPDGWNKLKGNAQYTAAALYHFFVPVNTVPVNILNRVGLGLRTPVTMAEAMSKNKAIREGILNMSQEDSDLLMRQLKKGQIGTAYWTLGFILGASALGGLYTKYDPDKERSGPKINEMNLGGTDVPKDVQHNTQFQSMQMGATWKIVYDHFIDDKGASQMEALAKATAATAGAATESIPTLQAAAKIYEAIQTPAAGEKWVKDLKKRVGIEKGSNLLQMMGYGDDDSAGSGGGGGAGSTFKIKEWQ